MRTEVAARIAHRDGIVELFGVGATVLPSRTRATPPAGGGVVRPLTPTVTHRVVMFHRQGELSQPPGRSCSPELT
ncbi:hypothetical protein [Amycolatopsis thermoflava]|uniref:hypothetical protein n=1 Tax=Amycolatopsis thermoflava TaxID=84480 RepID=UPI0003F83B76|nr:hypothetical protein [Amycolatopsis thermoflava]